MSPRPIYGIAVEDFIDHVEWFLTRDGDRVATGRVELAAYEARPEVSMVGMAFARAWQDANHERVGRFLEDLREAHALARAHQEEEAQAQAERDRAERDLDASLSEVARELAEEVDR